MSGEISFQDFAGQSPVEQPEEPVEQPVAQPRQPSAVVPFEDFRSGKTPGKQMFEDLGIDKRAPSGFIEKTLSGMKSVGGSAAVLADMILGAPWFAISFGANLGNQVTGLAFGQDLKTAAQSGRKVQEGLMEDFGNPLHQLMKIIDNGFGTQTVGGYSDSDAAELFGHVSSAIDNAGQWVEKKTNGAIPSEEVATMADGLMLLAGAKGGDIVKRLWDQRKKFKEANPDYVPPEVPMEQTQKQGPRLTAQQDINEMLNIRSTRDRRAYEQKRRREVREAFNNDSPETILPDGRRQGGGNDFANYLKFLAEERVSNHDNWTKAAREQEVREQAARASDDPAVPKPAEPTADEITSILNKPGFSRTAEDLIALRRYNARQNGYVKPELLARMAAFGLGATAGLMLDPEDPGQAALLGAAAAAPTLLMGGPGRVPSKFGQSGAVKGPGGMWHPEAVERLARPLQEKFNPPGMADEATVSAASRSQAWADKAIRNYLNKYAGTERDPLKDVEVPHGEGTARWEQLWDATIGHTKGDSYKTDARFSGVKPEEPVFNIWQGRGKFPPESTNIPYESASKGITSYLSHVGDYLRQNVKPEELQRYDLVRAVRETAANDARMAKEMEKAQAASTKDLPVYKEYPDGMRWVELKLPEKLTEEQARGVRQAQETNTNEMGERTFARIAGHVAVDSQGKPIRNAYTGDYALGKTPEEAWLAGRLAEEGNQMGHCVGGYCEGVVSGDSRIFSLRDKKGGSHVTVEVQPKNPRKINQNTPAPEDMEELGPQHMRNTDDIVQIKGKQNRAPNAEYLPYVQDFVKGGKWGEVGDFEHTGLWRNRKGEILTSEELHKRVEALHKESNGRFPNMTLEDVKEAKAAGGSKPIFNRTLDEALNLGAHPDWRAGARGRQEGSIDIKTAAKLAGLAGGAVAGASMADNKVMGAILGGLGGLMVGGASPRGVANVVKKAWAPDTRIRINNLANSWEYKTEASARAVHQIQTRIEQLLPKESDRVAVTHAIESGDVSKLTPRQRNAAQLAQSYFARMADVGQEAGVLKDAIGNYVTHLWQEKGAGVMDEIFPRKGGNSMSPETKFALRRSVPTIAEGKAKGLVPITEDISSIMGVYGNAISRAMANRELITALKNEKVPGTDKGLVLKDRDAPAEYKRIDHPQLAGMRVHPDIVPSMKFIFDNYQPGVVMRGLDGLNMISKRLAVSFSLFHAKALADAMIGAARNPLVVGKFIAQAAAPKIFGENIYLKMYREGGAGDLIDVAQKAGLKFSVGREAAGVEDVQGNFYGAMKDLQTRLDDAVKGAGLPVKGFIKANHAMDGFMWHRLHAGMKLAIFAEKYATLLENNAKAHARDPMVPMRPKEQLAEMAASFTNDVFGGLNWRRIAESASTRWGREVALNLLSPAGRRVSQLLMFAPDWTLSTARAAYKAFNTGGTGPRGIIEPKTETDLHRQYLIRSAIYYLAVGDAINLAMSGQHLWDNKDPTTIDMGDGRRMQWSKHTMESVHWLTKPSQQGLNKLGYFPREIANQALGTEYLSAYGKSPPMKNRFEHALRGFSPIAVQQNFDAGAGSGIAGFLGTPIYGKTYAEREALKEQRRLQNRMGIRREKPQ